MSKIGTWLIWSCVVLTILFFVISSPFVYTLTNNLMTTLKLPSTYTSQGSTTFGQLAHGIIFGSIIYFVLYNIYTTFSKPTDPTIADLRKRNGGIVPID